MAGKPDKKKSKDKEDLLALARKRFAVVAEAEREPRELALEDLEFAGGKQWDDVIKNARELDRKPCVTINRIPQFIRQITNDQRQNRPSIKVSPVDDNADIETAKIYQGIIRHIEHSSDADVAYDTAFDSAVRGGFGYYRVVTEYCDPTSFDQDIKIKRIRNRFSVYLDPNYQQPDGSDANWGFVFEDLSREEYEAAYPDSELASLEEWKTVGDQSPEWVKETGCRVAEYFYKELEDVDLVLLSDKSVIEKSKLPEFLPEGLEIVGERKSQIPRIKWCKINAVEVLEETDWPGKYIPIIPVLGEESDINGKRILEGIVRHAKDSQRMYNYWASNETETIALAPRAPWIGAEGQFEGHEEKWMTANTRNHAFLEYKNKTLNGQPIGPPQRNVFEPPVQAITQARMLASEDLKATTGIYDAALGAKSNENSGIAIQRRNIQAQTSNFHFMDNLVRSIRHTGRILIDLIPHIYDTERAIRILGEDGSEEVVRINEQFQHKGELVSYNLGVGKYDVTVNAGPSFETKRQEAVQAMLEFTKAMPNLAANIADLLVKNMDWPGAQEISERLKKMLPPGMADDKEKKALPPEAQQQMQQMNQMIEQLTQQLNEAQDKIQYKTVELESKERIEMAKLETQAAIELAKLESKEAVEGLYAPIEYLKQQISELDQRTKQLGFDEPFENEFEGQPMDQGMPMDQGQPIEEMNQQLTGEESPGLPVE